LTIADYNIIFASIRNALNVLLSAKVQVFVA